MPHLPVFTMPMIPPGHSQIAVTMNIYAHVIQDTQREAVSHLDRMLKRQRPDRG
ncbi:hypothetical protein ACVWXU_006659 [Streptomyces sp. TE33382]